jgi:(S)-2-hydroxyglutarate dehydrogenase
MENGYNIFDVVIIGGGVIGVATLNTAIQKHPHLKICLIEKEKQLALHQSGRNSGVIHCGYNQPPGTLKAKFVVEGAKRLKQFCRNYNIPIVENGILVVAHTDEQYEILKELYNNGIQNKVKVELVDEKTIKKIEPYANGKYALFAPEGASFDARTFVLTMAKQATAKGAMIFLGEKVLRLEEKTGGVKIYTTQRTVIAKVAINCAGLYADRIAHQVGIANNLQIIPFKGEYYQLQPQKNYLVKSHIYPTPNPAFPFIGVHLSRSFDNRIFIGPSATLIFSREGYKKFAVNPTDTFEITTSKGFWNMLLSKNFIALLKKEWKKALLKEYVVKEARQLVPLIEIDDLIPAKVGIRAQLVTKNGEFVSDFIIETTPATIHILNAVSPALTSSLPFADYILNLLETKI